MSGASDYPFVGAVVAEMSHLLPFDDAIVKYAKWKIEPMLNKDQDSNLSMQEYLKERAEKTAQVLARRDVAANAQMKFGR